MHGIEQHVGRSQDVVEPRATGARVEEHAPRPGNPPDRVERLDGAHLVVGRHHAHEHRVVSDRAIDVRGIEAGAFLAMLPEGAGIDVRVDLAGGTERPLRLFYGGGK